MRLFIVNNTDKPCVNMLAHEIDFKLWYLHNKAFGPMSNLEAQDLQDFGFTCFEIKGRPHCYEYVLTRRTNAVYKGGLPRKWQGKKRFTVDWSDPLNPCVVKPEVANCF